MTRKEEKSIEKTIEIITKKVNDFKILHKKAVFKKDRVNLHSHIKAWNEIIYKLGMLKVGYELNATESDLHDINGQRTNS